MVSIEMKTKMKVSFDNIIDFVVPLEQFPLNWRFTDENFDKLPDLHLEQLKPLNKNASEFIWDFIHQNKLHEDAPFKKGFFWNVDRVKVAEGNQKEIRKWLYERGLPFGKEVFLSWQPTEAMIVPWKLLVKYFDSFYYPISDDLTVIDVSLEWAMLFYHENEIYFGTNRDFRPSSILDG
ncbi:hypothetical protein [Rufibacter hautae]|uniref:Uncharacterized protein n=1 Tax=Rufibacter hautae TaxID=2595005 RepID=A0A5B6TBM7_9BACT|nr:hypothetical protein [Rufibacter hautae]KAA3436361.1 hypothetical protein FOA19_18365 [Rufibacter hautae]